MKILILTVGTNPLPLYVSATYLISTYAYDRLIFVYSKGDEGTFSTKETAEIIAEMLRSRFKNLQTQFLEIEDISDLNSTVRKVSTFPDDFGIEKRKISEVHLNYTGGTKVMCVGAHLALKDFNNFSASYLNPRSHSIVGDVRCKDLRNEIKMSMEDILKLHGYVRHSHEDTVNTIELLKKGGAFRKSLDFLREDVKRLFVDGKQSIKSQYSPLFRKLWKKNEKEERKYQDFETYLTSLNAQERAPSPPGGRHEQFTATDYITATALAPNFFDFEDPYNIFLMEDGKFKSIWQTADKTEQKKFKKKLTSFEYLDGKFLEFLVFDYLQEIQSDHSELLTGHSLTAKRPDGKNFELDNYVLYGYQLIGITVTTDYTAPRQKEKIIEAYHRCKQIGGDEAKCIAVMPATSEQVAMHMSDVPTITGANGSPIKIIGLNDLNKIKQEIENFIFH